MKWLFGKSKWIHKSFGLALILFLLLMSISGILLNHPLLIPNLSVPSWMVPPQYRVSNWNRGSLITMQFSKLQPGTAYLAGKLGVWKTTDGGNHFTAMTDHFPSSDFFKKTNTLYLEEGVKGGRLFAGTDGGLYVCTLKDEQWQRIPLAGGFPRVVKILPLKKRLLVLSKSNFFISGNPDQPLRFSEINSSREEGIKRVSLVRLFFDLHDGSIWGQSGRLLFDFAGLLLIFLSASAFYIWYYPWKRAKKAKQGSTLRRLQQKTFRLFYKYHMKIGIFAALTLLIMGGTGFFMRPPVLALIANGSIPVKWFPGHLSNNPWDEKIQNALYDPVEDRIIVQAVDGFWGAKADFSAPFQKIDLNLPVFVMGTTVFEAYGTGGYLAASFNGIFHRERATGNVFNLQTGQMVESEISNVRPADVMVTGYFKTPGGEEYITAHKQGLMRLEGTTPDKAFKMPPVVAENYRMSLWNFMFEIHNGRIFRDLIGGTYILIVPLGALLFVLLLLSGIFDWFFIKVIRKRTSRA